MNEEARLHMLMISKDTKIRELEMALVECASAGARLRDTLTYLRDEEPTPEQVHDAATDALSE